MLRRTWLLSVTPLLLIAAGCSRIRQPHVSSADDSSNALQPFAEHIRCLETTLELLGQPLDLRDKAHIQNALGGSQPDMVQREVARILEKDVIASVDINAESQVDLRIGTAQPSLVQGGASVFLVQINNRAGTTSSLSVASPNSGPVYIPSTFAAEPKSQLTAQDVSERWADISLFNAPPMSSHLSGSPLEYAVLVISSRDAGYRTAKLSFAVGDRPLDSSIKALTIPFRVTPATQIDLHILDSDGEPTTASLIVQDEKGRIFPSQAKRLAPDFYFQPQVYRHDGENLLLPPGDYTITSTGGPEYRTATQKLHVANVSRMDLPIRLERWIDPAALGWFSGDDHIHPAGCSHYENPTQGVDPRSMDRQVQGEHLNFGAVLVWGPCFYYQKQFFRGRSDDPSSTLDSLLHYDLEVSGFPSSHAGHLVLLNLQSLTFRKTERIEQWPTWDLPVLRWAKSQNAATGFAHSGWGLQVHSDTLPNYEIPPFDGIGANEYIVDVTQPGLVDFISAGDTPYVWELNIWYHTLNVGFRTRLSGETDFPCIYDERVGQGRTYAKLRRPLSFTSFVNAVKDGAAYVSDGRSHLMNFAVNGVEVGTHNSQINIEGPQTVNVEVLATAMLPEQSNSAIDELPYNQRPYWSLERARIGTTRKVPVELIVNGQPVAKQEIVADGSMHKLKFAVPLKKSSWMAVRILPSSHTDPIFALVDGKPIRASRRSAIWCLKGVDEAWKQKSRLISPQELQEAKQAYEHARQVYRQLATESAND
ncbi:CehA/McbA family metallohydrolase [Edaphobacter flagellatus]|uniref:CehA/McbA family metallohydrolase n=1 Tax=Edaphobacter flagellatus TaxID=1933044 RepID=UPI0021B1EFEF|nr:CehA/McbA family metallohydrolase [Edaphobacter flagellatus]